MFVEILLNGRTDHWSKPSYHTLSTAEKVNYLMFGAIHQIINISHPQRFTPYGGYVAYIYIHYICMLCLTWHVIPIPWAQHQINYACELCNSLRLSIYYSSNEFWRYRSHSELCELSGTANTRRSINALDWRWRFSCYFFDWLCDILRRW